MNWAWLPLRCTQTWIAFHPHVLEADKAVRIGPAPSSESHLRGEYLIEVAGSAGAGAIHPGYGFLAERASFAAAVEKAGLVFIGPSPESIQAMGNKTEARRRMAEAGVPIIPGAVTPTSGSRGSCRHCT